jgi:hypothetical protein
MGHNGYVFVVTYYIKQYCVFFLVNLARLCFLARWPTSHDQAGLSSFVYTLLTVLQCKTTTSFSYWISSGCPCPFFSPSVSNEHDPDLEEVAGKLARPTLPFLANPLIYLAVPLRRSVIL